VGDDNTWTVSNEAHGFYNAVSVIEVWKTLGVTTTTDSFEAREAEYLDFLSAQFLPMSGVMVPIYDRDKVMNSVYYAPKKQHSPCVTLERTAALLSIGWTDLQIRKFCRNLISYLMEKYDKVLYEDEHWIRAKTQIQSDEIYHERFTGIRLHPQSRSGKREKLEMPDKKENVSFMSDGTYVNENIASRIERSENALNATLIDCEVSPAGRSYIDTVLDPYKDSQGRPPCVGRPDMGQRNIVVSSYVQTQTISRPAGLAAGATWDCHVINTQHNSVINMRQTGVLGETLLQQSGALPTLYPYGGLMVMTGAAGTFLSLPQCVANLAVPQTYWLGQNNARVIGKAHQVTNTTALLTVAGNALMYEKTMVDPFDTLTTTNVCYVGSLVRHGALALFDDEVAWRDPSTLIQIPKTRQHAAKLGCYQVCTQCGPRNSPGMDRGVLSSYSDGISTYVTDIDWIVVDAGFSSPNLLSGNFPFVSPFNVNGTYFTGLSYETTLVVSGTWIVEFTPATGDAKIMSLTHPSPPYDPCAIELYEKISHALPAGVSVKDNAAGDWIQTIAALAQEAGAPGAGLLKMGGKLINSVQDFYKTDFGKMTKTGNNPSGKSVRPKLRPVRRRKPAQRQLVKPVQRKRKPRKRSQGPAQKRRVIDVKVNT
jgi:hypothetical protein